MKQLKVFKALIVALIGITTALSFVFRDKLFKKET